MVQHILWSLVLTTLLMAVHSETSDVLLSITSSSPTTSFTACLNQVVDIHLETCFECGNEWMLQSSPEAILFKAKDKTVIVPETGLGAQVYTFIAQGKGKATLTFIYRPMGTKGSADAMARVIVQVTVVDPQLRKLPPPTPALTTAKTSVPALGPTSTPYQMPAQIMLTSASPSSSITASMSQTLAIAFESCGTCGYQWVQLDSTPAFLVPLTVPNGVYTAPNLPAGYSGGSRQQLFSYSSLAPGTAAVTFAYGRPWTPGVYEAQVVVSITVTP